MQSSQIASIIVALLTLIGCAFAPEPGVLLLVGITLITGLLLLWSRTGIPVLLLPFLLQWLAVATKPIESAITGIALIDLADFNGDLAATAIFASLALIGLAFGMWAGMLSGDRNTLRRLQADIQNWPDRNILPVGIGFVVIGHVLTPMAGLVAGLAEILLALANITYCGLFMLVYWSLRTRRQVGIVAAITALEILFGMSGFFGVFKTTLFTLALAAMCAQHRFKPQTIITAAILMVPAFLLTVFWTSVKSDYRQFLNNDTKTQSVQQPMSARLNFLSERVGAFDREQFDDGFAALIRRISYIDFLSRTLEYVPANTPHENGSRTFAAVTHIFTPRIIFTNKPALQSDTEVTARYTGLAFTDYSYASISLGYLGEAYVDFGWYGAIIFTFVLGLIIGVICKFIIGYRAIPMLFNVGLAMMIVIPSCYFEQALIKIIGATTTTVIAAFLLQRIAFPLLVQNFLIRQRAMRVAPSHAEQRNS